MEGCHSYKIGKRGYRTEEGSLIPTLLLLWQLHGCSLLLLGDYLQCRPKKLPGFLYSLNCLVAAFGFQLRYVFADAVKGMKTLLFGRR